MPHHTAPIHLPGDQQTGGWRSVEVVHISDTHGKNREALRGCPGGDILLHTGDFTDEGNIDELKEFVRYIHKFPHKYKIVLAGNHEISLPKLGAYKIQNMLNDPALLDEPERAALHARPPVIYLQDSSAIVCGIHFYGTPWTSCRAMAFGGTEEQRAAKFASIPANTDVLLSHSPPYAYFDLAWSRPRPGMNAYHCPTCDTQHEGHFHHWGCQALRQAVEERAILLHCYGHVHDQTGSYQVGPTVYSNAAFDLHGHKATGKFTLMVPGDRPHGNRTPVYKDLLRAIKNEVRSYRTRFTRPWSIHPDTPCLIRNGKTRNVLDVDYNRKEPGTAVIGYPTTGAANQQWRFLPGGHLESVSSRLVLDADTEKGLQPIIYKRHKGANQKLEYCSADGTLRLGMKGRGGATLVLTDGPPAGTLHFSELGEQPSKQQQWEVVTTW